MQGNYANVTKVLEIVNKMFMVGRISNRISPKSETNILFFWPNSDNNHEHQPRT